MWAISTTKRRNGFMIALVVSAPPLAAGGIPDRFPGIAGIIATPMSSPEAKDRPGGVPGCPFFLVPAFGFLWNGPVPWGAALCSIWAAEPRVMGGYPGYPPVPQPPRERRPRVMLRGRPAPQQDGPALGRGPGTGHKKTRRPEGRRAQACRSRSGRSRKRSRVSFSCTGSSADPKSRPSSGQRGRDCRTAHRRTRRCPQPPATAGHSANCCSPRPGTPEPRWRG